MAGRHCLTGAGQWVQQETTDSVSHLLFQFFSVMTSSSWVTQIRRGIYSSVKDLEQKFFEFIDSYNENAEPFVWTKTSEEVLTKVARAKAAMV